MLYQLAKLNDIPNQALTPAKYQTLDLLIYRDDNDIYVVQNFCPHMGFPLNNAQISDSIIKCTHHNFKFSLVDGKCLTQGVICDSLRVQSAQIENEMIGIEEYKLIDWL